MTDRSLTDGLDLEADTSAPAVGWRDRLPGRDDWLIERPGEEPKEPRPARPPAHRRELRPASRLLGWGGAAVVAALTPLVVDPILLGSLTRALAIALALLGLQVLLGHAGLLSLGQGAMLGIGAWTAGTLVTDVGLGPVATIPVTAAVSAGVGILIGLPALRLSRIGLVLLTLAIAVSFPLLFQKFVGPLGRAYDDAPPPAWTGFGPADEVRWAYAVAVVAVALAYSGLRLLLGGRFGRSLRAVRDEPIAAAAFGVPVARVRLAAFALAAALGGAGGAVLLVQSPFVYGPDFPFQLSIQLFAIVLLVGADRLAGALAGGVFLVLLPRALSVVGLIGYEDLVYSLILLAVIVAYRGRGIGPVVHARLVTGPLGRELEAPTATGS